MKMRFVTILLLLSISFTALPQSKIDSLQNALENNRKSAAILLDLAYEYARIDYDSSLIFANRALEIGKENQNDSVIANSYSAIGQAYYGKASYDTAQHNYSLSLDLFENLNDSIGLGAVLTNIGTCYSYQSKYEESLNALFRAREIRESIEDIRLSSTVNNIGLTYYKMYADSMALKYYKQAAELKRHYGQIHSLSNTLNNIGIIYRYYKKYDSAAYYYNLSLAIAIEFDDLKKQANAHNNLAIVYEHQDDFDQSATSYEKSIELKTKLGDLAGLFNSYHNYAKLLIKNEKYRQANEMLGLADDLSKELGENIHTSVYLLTKSHYYRAIGNYQLALEFTHQAMLKRVDEVNNDRNKKIAQWEVKYETAKKDAEIEQLDLENKVQKLGLEVARNQMIGLGIAIIVIVLGAVIFYILRTKKIEAERIAQEHQLDALKQRLLELQMESSSMELTFDLADLNNKLHTPLTEREHDTLTLSLTGKSNSEIANELFVSINTVKFHLRNIYQKLGVGNKKEIKEYIIRAT